MAQLALLFSTLFWFLFSGLSVLASPLETLQYSKRSENGIHLPIFRTRGLRQRSGLTGEIGVGDFFDVTYSFLVTVGGVETPLLLDTGSSDLWIASDACKACKATVPLFPQSSFVPAGVDVDLLYGDSLTGTHAAGVIGSDTVTFAGISVNNQLFAAINDTDTTVLDAGSAGIFGLGFALNSVIWNKAFAAKFTDSKSSSTRRSLPRRILSSNYGTRFFPDLNKLLSGRKRATSSAELTQAVLGSFPAEGPALTRMVTTKSLAAPVFTITLQRDTVDIGGNAGVLTLGQLPDGLQAADLTWAPVRKYPNALQAPADSPNEEYPIAWEIFIDDVFLDGAVLPRSNLSSSAIKLSGLVDTGNSLIRGPADVVDVIHTRIGSTFACSTPHTLAFSIGGKLFPVDPRDFINQASDNELTECAPNVVQTDAPVEGQGYQYSWSLGDPFLKSVLATFYYGNITYPSVDPPCIGLMSTVPADAGTQLESAIASAIKDNGANEFTTSTPAPTGVPVGGISGGGVPLAPVGKLGGSNNTNDATSRGRTPWLGLLAVPLVGGLLGLI
ncbi:aspartic peptidase domain-containing protein [Mycena metata]|uniref:Aspartic peptidase domain-containing protein n=1 Tax=Mycena metata TaxID=1033252 RepID=A0AAD7NWU2_9AGAR|nr:aspartic peptidase domain-containing protein [Mycena metata]